MAGGVFGTLISDVKGAGYQAQWSQSSYGSGKTVGESIKALETQVKAYEDLLPTESQERVSRAQIMQAMAKNLEKSIPASGTVFGRGNDAAKSALGRIARDSQDVVREVTSWPQIPKIIHIIHLGSALPSNRFPYVLPNLHSFKKTNEAATVNLWIDRSFLKKAEFEAMTLDAATHHYEIKDFMTVMQQTKQVESKQLSPGGPRFNTVLDNTSDVGKLYGLVDQLLSKKGQITNKDGSIGYNWGLISDLMRIAILLRYGGIYFDTDMAAGKTLPQMLYAKHGILVNVKGHQMTPCNDIIAAIPNHKVMKDYCSAILTKMSSDQSSALFKKLIDKTAPANDLNNPVLRSATINTSGPSTLRSAVQENIASTKNDAMILPKGRYAKNTGIVNSVIGKDYSEVIFPPCYVQDTSTSGKAWLK